MSTKTDGERIEFLQKLGLSASAPGLTDRPAKTTHVKAVPSTIVLAPPNADPRTMPVDEIVFDEHLLDQFPSLEGDGLKAASDYVFSLYKSYGRDKPRNSLLHRKITSFITLTRRNRAAPGMVKENVKSTKSERDMAALLASQNVDTNDLVEALRLLAEKRSE